MLLRHELSGLDSDRYYLTYTPSGTPSGEPASADGWPLVIAFHGGGSTPLDMARFCGLTEAADRHGFAVVYPSGSGTSPEYLTWNAGACCGHAARRGVDDVAFMERLLTHFEIQLPIDNRRIYATGMSNGGMFCYRLAAAMPDRIAAIAPVAGCLACDPPSLNRPVPVLHFHGTEDQFVPYYGGAGLRSLRQVNFRSVSETLAVWVRACNLKLVDGARNELITVGCDELLNDQPLSIHRRVLARQKGRDVVVEIRIDGGGHTWPGQAPPLCFLGSTLLSLSANDVMWEFFAGFRC